ncbi:CUZD1 [Branchiostoma lanceolatum]|uniref:CUZD1 protein n=1 Tax=Branchiostoma lanceolatum TaxID=7740 RepID=A0A8J9V786_BRALA|nr:CUZD1 [Branchiostoma lanceolatum]
MWFVQFILVGTVFIFLILIDEAALLDEGCPTADSYVRFDGICYKDFDEAKSYNGARARCAADGALLAMPKDSATNTFLADQRNGRRWLGLTDKVNEGRWVFEDGRILTSSIYSNWIPGSPGGGRIENCACYRPLSDPRRTGWNDCSCIIGWKGFICQVVQCPSLAAPTNGDVNSSNVYLGVAQFTCDVGYVMSGSSTVTCQANGTWSGQSPTCNFNGTWTPWGSWRACDSQCGFGTKTRSRVCDTFVPELYGSCPGQAQESLICYDMSRCHDGGAFKTKNISINIEYSLSWLDGRLAGLTQSWVPVPSNSIWSPPVAFGRTVRRAIATSEEDNWMWFDPRGLVVLKISRQLSVNCVAHLALYPLDTQVCTLALLGYDGVKLRLQPSTDVTNAPVKSDATGVVSQFTLVGVEGRSIIQSFISNNTDTNSFDMLEVRIHLRRIFWRYILSDYLPSVVIVASSYLQTWLPVAQSDVTARVTLGAMAILSMEQKEIRAEQRARELNPPLQIPRPGLKDSSSSPNVFKPQLRNNAASRESVYIPRARLRTPSYLRWHQIKDKEWVVVIKSEKKRQKSASAPEASPKADGCPTADYVFLDGVCYKDFSELRTYGSARGRCAADGGLLAMPKDSTTNTFLADQRNERRWLGLTDVISEGQWVLEDGRTLTSSVYSNWSPGEPGGSVVENCASYPPTLYGSVWIDIACDRAIGFICQVVPCLTPAAPMNGDVTSLYYYMGVVQFTCDLGYFMTGSSTLTCEADGSWSGDSPTCTAVPCPALAVPKNGDVSSLNYYLDVAQFTCDAGYLMTGSSTVICQADGTWSGGSPTCIFNGTWTPWGSWRACDSQCGFGTKTRSRVCDTFVPELYGSCPGQAKESSICYDTSRCHDGGAFGAKDLFSINEGNVSWPGYQRFKTGEFLPTEYDASQGPNDKEELYVASTIYITRVGFLSEEHGNISINIEYSLSWLDGRLAGLTQSWVPVPSNSIWSPPVAFGRTVRRAIATSEEDNWMWFDPRGLVVLKISRQLSVNCVTHLALYPLDTQVCTLALLGYNGVKLRLQPSTDTIYAPVKSDATGVVSQFTLVGVEGRSIIQSFISNNTDTNSFDMLEVRILLRRIFWRYILKDYLPSVVIVASSYLQTWLPVAQSDVTARVTLGAMAILSIVKQWEETEQMPWEQKEIRAEQRERELNPPLQIPRPGLNDPSPSPNVIKPVPQPHSNAASGEAVYIPRARLRNPGYLRWHQVKDKEWVVVIKSEKKRQNNGSAPEASPKADASTTCTNDYMELSIPEDELTDIDKNNLHWEPDQNCGATTNGTHYLFRTDLYGCGTQVTFEPTSVIFLNTITIWGIHMSDDVITRKGDIMIICKCEYQRKQWVHATFLPIPGGLNFTEEGFGQLEILFTMFPTRQYQTPYQADQFPIHRKLGEQVYLQLEVQGHGKNLAVLALNCKATMSPEPNDTLKYQLINDGCASDQTVDIYSIDNPAKERFGFEAFRFIQEVKTVYVHCEVMVCDTADPGSRCEQGCVTRRKRAINEEVDMIGRHMIYLGPIVLDDDEAGTDEAAPSSASQATLAAGGGLIALSVVVTGTVILAKRLGCTCGRFAYQGLT